MSCIPELSNMPHSASHAADMDSTLLSTRVGKQIERKIQNAEKSGPVNSTELSPGRQRSPHLHQAP